MKILRTFKLGDKDRPIRFIETQNVKDGVVCYIYEFIDDDSSDLGVIEIKAGQSTPKQKVLLGDRTIEGHLEGEGVLAVTNDQSNMKEYTFPSELKEVSVKVGEIMQWTAKTDLIIYEICYPAYTDGRFRNLD